MAVNRVIGLLLYINLIILIIRVNHAKSLWVEIMIMSRNMNVKNTNNASV
jgi:hypothetical protein